MQPESSNGKGSGSSGSSVLAVPVPSQTFSKPPEQQCLQRLTGASVSSVGREQSSEPRMEVECGDQISPSPIIGNSERGKSLNQDKHQAKE